MNETHIASEAAPPPRQMESDLHSLRVKVAELCPDIFAIHQTWRGPEGGGCRTFVSWKNGKEIQEREWLSACAEFERGLNDGQLYDYIWKLVGKHWFDKWDFSDVLKLARATAEQRCRAFVAVMEGNK